MSFHKIVRDKAVSKGIEKGNVLHTSLYIPVLLTANSGGVLFDLSEAGHGIGLNKNSIFLGSGHIGIGLQGATKANANSKPMVGNAEIVFNQEDLEGEIAADIKKSLEMIYTGTLEVKSDTKVRVQNYRAYPFKGLPKSSANHTKFTFVPFSPMVFVGGRQNTATLKFAANGDYSKIAGSDTFAIYAVLIVPGIEILGGAANADLVADLDAITS